MTEGKRGPAGATRKAASYLLRHPRTSGRELARRFDIDISTVYRADWWKKRPKQA